MPSVYRQCYEIVKFEKQKILSLFLVLKNDANEEKRYKNPFSR